MGKSEAQKAKRFAKNLRALIQRTELTQEQAAKKIGVPVNWLRKACYDGIARSHPRNEDRLERLRDFFRLKSPHVLWQPTLPKVIDGFVFSTHESELELAIARLTLAYHHSPSHLKVRKALVAIEKAVDIVADEEQHASGDRCELCDKELARREMKRGVCRECLRVGAAKSELRAKKLRAEQTGKDDYDRD